MLTVGFSMGGALAITSLVGDGAEADGLILLAPFTRFVDPRSALLPFARHLVRSWRPYAAADFSDPVVREKADAGSAAISISMIPRSRHACGAR